MTRNLIRAGGLSFWPPVWERGLLFKSLIAIVFPVAAGLIYLLLTHQLFSREIWKRLHVVSGALIVILIAAPWYVLATLRNPPYFDFTMHGGPGQYHGFFWFFFINEQLLTFFEFTLSA